ncbi:glutamate synthase subunit beta [Clostridium aestuarii]|uniref:Glutamate synthase subunit beta n=1 Tax=Clostridium aestuarii TaxID=338193 RepID=A0ABT4CWI5_9CLOT|nr:glutamate synthase subunit beta [Clostridium aestuarii]MCY6483360.1 glutamate synthase subunit beta [Clostridium aestuarii]
MGKLTGFKEFERNNFNKRSVKERVKDYKEVYVPLTKEEMQQQAARCMDCGTAFCNWGCPLGNLIPDWNDMVYRDDWKKAFDRLNLTSNFPEFTGRICPALCEAACALGVNRKAVSIREIEVSIIEKAYKEGWVKPNPPKVRTGKKVAVVGSGPAGLAAAAELNSAGHNVVLFERADEIGGLLRYGIPDFKLEKNVIDRRISIMEQEGIEFKTNTNVGVDIKAEEFTKEFDAVVLTGGSTIPRDLKAEGRDLKGVHFAMEFLSQQNKKAADKKIDGEEITAKDKVVVVIGGGDTGSDCVGTSLRQGAKNVYQYEIMPKPSEERNDTMPWPTYPKLLKVSTSHQEGFEEGNFVQEWNVGTKKFIGKNGKLIKLNGIKVEWTKDENGRMNLNELEGTEFEIKADLVLLAMGFLHPQHAGVINDLQLELDERGNIKTDEKHMTSKKGIFAAGDMRTGQSLVVKAINDGRVAAKSVDEYLMGETFLRG